MKHYQQFTNSSCEFYPCHKTDRLNCLFCYCPLYFLDCGGHFTLTARGIKDCSNCLLPHQEGGYDYIVSKLMDAMNDRLGPADCAEQQEEARHP